MNDDQQKKESNGEPTLESTEMNKATSPSKDVAKALLDEQTQGSKASVSILSKAQGPYCSEFVD
jgi:hypothetical protein